jgi:hypothetical protein
MHDKECYKKILGIEFMLAVRNKEHDQVTNYLDGGRDVNTQSHFDTTTEISLLAASIKNRDAEMAGILLSRNADVNIALVQVEGADRKFLLNVVKEVESYCQKYYERTNKENISNNPKPKKSKLKSAVKKIASTLTRSQDSNNSSHER